MRQAVVGVGEMGEASSGWCGRDRCGSGWCEWWV